MTRASGQFTTKGKGKAASNSAAKRKGKTRVAKKGAAQPGAKGKKQSQGQPKHSQKPSPKTRGTTRGTARPDDRGTARDTARGAARSAAKGAAKQAARAEARGQAKVGAEIELFIESLAAGGEGVGRDAGGRVTFVPYTAPGDAIKARLVEAHKDYARGEPLQIMVSSVFRVNAPCPHFVARTCGGCQWQHLGEAVQASAKDELAARVLRKHVSAGMELHPLRAEVQPYYWRRRARLHWYRPRKADAATLGFFAPRSHLVADIPGCVQLEPVLKQAVDILRAELRARARPSGRDRGPGQRAVSWTPGRSPRVHPRQRGRGCSRGAGRAGPDHRGDARRGRGRAPAPASGTGQRRRSG